MTAARLIPLLLLILVAVVLVVVLLRRGSAQRETQRETQRVEAADLRTHADELATTMSGQAAFADQAAERADVARVEAERHAREAQRLEAEAAEQQAAVEATRRDYETTMRRADDIDPDVEESSFPPVDAASTDGAAADHTADRGDPDREGDDTGVGEAVMSRGERRVARDAEETAGLGSRTVAVASAPPTAGGRAAGGGAAGGGAAGGPESERIASAVDFRDDVSGEADDEAAPDRTEVYRPGGSGSSATMSDDLSHDAESPEGQWGGPPPEPAPAEVGAAVAETDEPDRSAADAAGEPVEEGYDPTPTRDWAADEGELLEETHARGERLEAERAELAQEGDDTTGDPAADDVSETAPTRARRISAFEELRDGGFGVGSAAPLRDGAQPLDHPVQAHRDSMTFRAPGDPGYDSVEPHVWFHDEGAAQRSGFHRAEG